MRYRILPNWYVNAHYENKLWVRFIPQFIFTTTKDKPIGKWVVEI